MKSDFPSFFPILFSKSNRKQKNRRTLKSHEKKKLIKKTTKKIKKLTNKIFQLVHEPMSHTGAMFVRQLTPVGTF